jgi:hypothetical protein
MRQVHDANIAAGAMTPVPQPQVTGIAVGSATVTASAPGYTSGMGTVTVQEFHGTGGHIERMADSTAA